ncbi:hypothetical protein [Lysobacter capsici]|uniref:hypothetical protein n=1 Tax=Lysobacter capsici TaxID=435897 RepID=UPI001C006505|nr:hypothetical protein [Lysobacter capsici]QWF15153.1 hypothetical protein KME82_15235 [Lysobacter capsici]
MLELLMDAMPRDVRGVGADAQRAALRAAWMDRAWPRVADRVDRTRIRVLHEGSNVAVAAA